MDEGNSSEVERLLETEAVMVNVCNRVSRLQLAAELSCGSASCFFPVLFQHAETPLHIAAGYGKLDVVMSLCRHGATVDALDKVS